MKMGSFKLKRLNGPLISPVAYHSWESQAVFNPGTVRESDDIHLLYRAVEGHNFSTIGYAKLDSDGKIVKRLNRPVIIPESLIEMQGCEDPRINFFEGKYYIFYTGFDGADITRSANTRVMLAETTDFKHYTKLGMIGPDDQDKDAMIFPERINEKIYFIHRIAPNIQVALFDSMEQLLNPGNEYWTCHMEDLNRHTLMCRQFSWESMKIGAGPPPFKTEAGWVLLYHGVDSDKVYRAGIALLDLKNPFKIVARLPYPVLEPETQYEKFGDVNNVVFPEGISVFDDNFLVFYGAADKVIGVATGKISDLLEELWRNKIS
jgi:predicted GH43/DUF377 family glycosyl hydrolase